MGGNPDAIMKAVVSTVMNMLHYEMYEADLSQAYDQIRQEENAS